MPVGDETYLRDLYNLSYLFGDKWVKAIMLLLVDGPHRRVDILSKIRVHPVADEWSDKHDVLHDSILTRTLKKMTAEGLLIREETTDTFPHRVYYSLAPAAVEFLKAAEPAVEWARRHPELIARAQAYRRTNGDVEDLRSTAGSDAATRGRQVDDGARGISDPDEDAS
jgi:DNA-binding HxlR family transcriptional regulator